MLGKYICGVPSVARSCERESESFIPAPKYQPQGRSDTRLWEPCDHRKGHRPLLPHHNFLGTDPDRIIGADSGPSPDKFRDELDNHTLKEVQPVLGVCRQECHPLIKGRAQVSQRSALEICSIDRQILLAARGATDEAREGLRGVERVQGGALAQDKGYSVKEDE